jgi:hypothetical protein
MNTGKCDNLDKYDRSVTKLVKYFWQIVTYGIFSYPIRIKISFCLLEVKTYSINFHADLSSGSLVFPCRETEG